MRDEIKELTENDFLNMSWNYFSLHANQRMQLLHFYILLETLFVTGLLALFQVNEKLTIFRLVLSVAIIFFSCIFFALDKRSKQMIEYSEDAIKNIEQKYVLLYSKEIMVFTMEHEKTSCARRWSWFAREILSYSKLLRFIYIFFTAIGLMSIVIEITNMCEHCIIIYCKF